jgi:hypothetical protein
MDNCLSLKANRQMPVDPNPPLVNPKVGEREVGVRE